MRVLGLSAFYHDSAAALLDETGLVAAAEEERFTRKKHDASFPERAVAFCLEQAGLRLADVDYVCFYDKPFLKFERLLETYLALAPRGLRSFHKAIPTWLAEKPGQARELERRLRAFDSKFSAVKLLFSEHHLSHAASAFYASPFADAAVLTLDGVGEWATSSLAVGSGSKLDILREMHFPHSLGLLYSAFTQYAGFKVNSGEYKLMGLSPYGEPRFAARILDEMIDLKADGSYRLDLRYFGYMTETTMINAPFEKLFGAPARLAEGPLTQHYMDIAASIQRVTEEVILRMARYAAATTGMKNLCLAGGVALNCVANGKLRRDGAFERIWAQPAAGDAGGALGAAYCALHLHAGLPRATPRGDAMRGAYLGPAFAPADARARLTRAGAVLTEAPSEAALFDEVAAALAGGAVVGWFQGRMEFGPRALGNRSILGDARSPEMQKTMNLRIKYRESFRPFAPAVLREDLSDWFEMAEDSPYMLFVADVAPHRRLAPPRGSEGIVGIARLTLPRSQIPAVTHVDLSARIQTVDEDSNPRFRGLLLRFKELTGCPVLANTSFNVRGEPIVCTPDDAFRCFMGTGIDLLVVDRFIMRKIDQLPGRTEDHPAQFQPD